MPNLVTFLDWIPIYECYVVKCRSKNGHRKDMYLKEIGLHTEILLIILGSEFNIIGEGGLPGRFCGSGTFDFEKSHMTISDSKNIVTLKSKLRIRQTTKNHHLRHAYLLLM